MAHRSDERHNLPDQIWFDANNPDPLHDAMRQDYAHAKTAIDRRPSLRRHVEDCTICRDIIAATMGAPAPTAGRRRMKLMIPPQLMHQLLNLPASFEIVHMFATDDPNAVFVMVAGDSLPEVGELVETPVTPVQVATERTTPTAS